MSGRRWAATTGARVCGAPSRAARSEEHTSELQSRLHLVCRLLLEKKKKCNLGETDLTLLSCSGSCAGDHSRSGTRPLYAHELGCESRELAHQAPHGSREQHSCRA